MICKINDKRKRERYGGKLEISVQKDFTYRSNLEMFSRIGEIWLWKEVKTRIKYRKEEMSRCLESKVQKNYLTLKCGDRKIIETLRSLK